MEKKKIERDRTKEKTVERELKEKEKLRMKEDRCKGE